LVDKARAVRLLDALRAALRDLDRYAGSVTAAQLKSDGDCQNMVLYAIYRAVQACIDLAHHIVSDQGLTVPATYRAVFDSLRAAGWIDADLAVRLAGWAGLRNVIAHSYVDIDLDRVHAALLERDDLHAYATTLADRIAREA